jgi:hypothetical protein
MCAALTASGYVNKWHKKAGRSGPAKDGVIPIIAGHSSRKN